MEQGLPIRSEESGKAAMRRVEPFGHEIDRHGRIRGQEVRQAWRRRAGDLAGFVAAARSACGLAAPVTVGFSDGANIAATDAGDAAEWLEIHRR